MGSAHGEDRFPRRGSTVLYVIAAVFAFGIFVALAGSRGSTVGVIVAVGLALNAAYLVWIANNLAARRPWARPVAIVVLWALVVFGVIDLFLALVQGRINVPIGAILAAYALLAPGGPIVFPTDREERARAQQALLVGLVLLVAPWVLGLMLARGS
jgi:hypothetical protein